MRCATLLPSSRALAAFAMLGVAVSATTPAAALETRTASTAPPACRAASGVQRLPVVELYTSEGCSSCPPADLRLQALSRASKPVVAPLAWHVAYWDYLGWRDPYASQAHAERQRRAVAISGGRTVYTPQFFVSGREVRDPGLVATEAVHVAATRPLAELQATIAPDAQDGWALSVSARGPADRSLQLIVAITEDGLVSSVKAGENAGERLRHAHVVRQAWSTPVAATGRIDWTGALRITPEQRAKGLDLVAFVQDARSGEVLQALRLPGCATSRS